MDINKEADTGQGDEAREAASQGGSGDSAAQPEAGVDLQGQLEAARAKAEENWERCLRTAAELDNVRKRAQRDKEQAQKFAIERFAREMIEVRDSLEMGLGAAGEADSGSALKEGIEATLRLFDQSLERAGVALVDPAGAAFDPELHEAMATRAEEGAAEGTVLDVVQKGYTLNGRLLRPARVFVAS